MQLPDESDSSLDNYEDDVVEFAEIVVEWLDGLPDHLRYKQVLELFLYGENDDGSEMTSKDIIERLGINSRNTYDRLKQNARINLKN